MGARMKSVKAEKGGTWKQGPCLGAVRTRILVLCGI